MLRFLCLLLIWIEFSTPFRYKSIRTTTNWFVRWSSNQGTTSSYTDYTDWYYKTKPQDFIVIEDRALERREEKTRRVAETIVSEVPAVAVETFSVDYLVEVLSSTQFAELDGLASAALTSTVEKGAESLVLEINPGLSKENRTRFHRTIAHVYPRLDSKTEVQWNDGSPEAIANAALLPTVIRIYPKGAKSVVTTPGTDYQFQKTNKKKVVVNQRWDRNNPDYLHFTVKKSMLSHAEMIDKLSRLTGMLPTRFEYCGSKDKRAITFQRVCAWRIDEELLHRINERNAKAWNDKNLWYQRNNDQNNNNNNHDDLMQNMPLLSISDITQETQPLRLGDLSGNCFIITLSRNNHLNNHHSEAKKDQAISIRADITASTFTQLLSTFAHQPFPNLFGPQRFGSPLQVNVQVGKLLLKGDYRGAVLLLLLTPTSEMEVQEGMLNLDILTEWVSHTTMSPSSIHDSDDQKTDDHSNNFFCVLLERWESYREKINIQHNHLKNLSPHVQPESTTNPDDRSSDDMLAMGYNDDNDLVEKEGEDPLQWMSMEPTDVETSSTSKASSASSQQWNIITSRLQCISDFLSGEPAFVYPRSTALLQGKLYTAIKEEISMLQRQQQPPQQQQEQQQQSQQAEASTSSSSPSSTTGHLENIDYFRVFSTLQKNLRLLFVNAYQSYVWNRASNERLNRLKGGNINRGIKAVEGDVVLVDVHGHPLTAWHVAAKNITLTANSIKAWSAHEHNPTPRSVTDLSEQSSATSAVTTTATTTKAGSVPSAYYYLIGPEDVGKYPIESVILPLPGVCTPKETIPHSLLTQMSQDDVSEILLDGIHKDRLFRLPGAYRHLLTSAKNVRVVYDNEWCPVDDEDGVSGAINVIKTFDEEIDRRIDTSPGTVLATAAAATSAAAADRGIKRTSDAVDSIKTIGEFPFVERVEEMWSNGELPSLLAETGMEFIKAGKQPTFSTPKGKEINKEGDDDKEDAVVRVSFSLCASTYATTYLEHLRDIINNNTP